MKNKKRKANLILFVVLAGALAAAARPSVRFLEDLIAEGGATTDTSRLAAVVLYGMLAIVALTALSGMLAVARGPVAGTSVLIILAVALCGVAIYTAVNNMPEDAPPEASDTPRPTVTPPEVSIRPTVRVNHNPETGTVFYRRYGNERATAIIKNDSQADICFRMFDKHGLLVLIFYVRAGEITYMPVPTGTYEFRCVTGRTWESEETYFGEKTRYRKLPDQYVFYDGDSIIIPLSSGLPEMKDIREKDFETFDEAYY